MPNTPAPPASPSTNDSSRGPMKPLFPLLTLIVLAALLVYGYVLNSDWNSTAEPSADPRSGEIRLVDPNPKAGIQSFQSFGWHFALPRGGHYLLSIKNQDSGALAVENFRTELPDFRPDVQQLADMGESIEIRVQAFGPDSDTQPLSETTRRLKVGPALR